MNHHRRKGDKTDVDTRGGFDTPVMHGTGHKPPKRPSPNSSWLGRVLGATSRRGGMKTVADGRVEDNRRLVDFLTKLFSRRSRGVRVGG